LSDSDFYKEAIFKSQVEYRNSSLPFKEVCELAFKRCQLGTYKEMLNPELITLFNLSVEYVAAYHSKLKERSNELAYHNLLHIQDCMTALSYLLLTSPELSYSDKLLGLIVMLVHDLGHEGKSNTELDVTQESKTLKLLESELFKGLSVERLKTVSELLLGTDPKIVPFNHSRFLSDPNTFNLLQVLINEADIAASIGPLLSEDLTKALLIERGSKAPSSLQIKNLYSEFSKGVSLSSSPGRYYLGFLQERSISQKVGTVGMVDRISFVGIYSANAHTLERARRGVEQYLSTLSRLSSSKRLDIMIGFGELIQNTVRHAFKDPDLHSFYRVEILDRNGSLIINVLDNAPPNGDVAYLQTKREPSEAGGMGINLIKKVTSCYDLTALPSGNRHSLQF